MMNNLFSIFDPSTNIFSLQLNWVSSFIPFMFIPYLYWTLPNRFIFIFMLISNKLNNEFNNLLGNNKLQGTTLMFISLFMLILFNNMMGLFPYIFTSTSHLILPLSISLTLWLSFMLYGWINNMNNMFIHMIPQGTPTILMPFMVMIETISNLIRPLTLAIRLTANMIAGHLLITLLSKNIEILKTPMLTILILTQTLLLTLEFSVSIIQSYVISTLSVLYSKEII